MTNVCLTAHQAYFAAGFTTAQESRSDLAGVDAFRKFSSAGQLLIDVSVFPDPGFYGSDEELKQLVNGQAPGYQNFEEHSKGSITPGKVADFVILNGNPLAAAPASLTSIEVVATIKGGKTVYSRP